MRFDGAVQVLPDRAAGETVPPPLWSHRCGWHELAETSTNFDQPRGELDLEPDWPRRWTATWKHAGAEVTGVVHDLASMPVTGCEPVRGFSWRRGQRHRPGLQFLVSTNRMHAFESLTEGRALLALDFAAQLRDVASQPMRLRFRAGGQVREHTPDFLADTANGRWLIDVRPAERLGDRDVIAFAAAAEAALLLGWRYIVVTGWHQHVMTTLDTISAQRRPLTDPLGLAEVLLAAVAGGPRPFGELAEATVAPAVARAVLLHLLWKREAAINLGSPLTDRTLVHAGALR